MLPRRRFAVSRPIRGSPRFLRLLCLLAVGFPGTDLCASPDPRISYLLHCGGCHLPDARGVPPEVPPLRDELGKLVRIPGGRDYIVRVPGASQAPVSDQGLADILNFVLLEFNQQTLGKDFKPFTAAEVSASRRNILADPFKYRDKLWQSYETQN